MSEELNNEVVNENPTVEEPVKTTESKTFTQEDLDKIVADRISRERKKFGDYDELKTKLSDFEKAELARKEAEMTELERYQSQLAEKDGQAQSLTKQLEELHAQVKDAKINNAFIKAAPNANIPADRIDAALKLADLSAVKIGEDGAIEGLDDVMNALVSQYTFLAKKSQKPIGEPSNTFVDTAEKTAEQQLREAAEKARITGKIEDKMAYATLKQQLKL